MAVHWSIFVPAVVFAHVLGGVLLLYSLEKVSGVVSKSWNRICGRIKNGAKTDDADQLRKSSETTPTGGPTRELETAAHKARAVASWKRGCTCEEGCYCVDRWVQRNKKEVEAGNATASHLAVQYPADLAWFDVTCHVLDQKTLKQKQVLHPVSGNAYPGECVALLGPSGAGKSTLLDILSLRKSSGKITGQVLMNGRPLGVQFKRNSAYVAQEDCFVPTMSAWETLKFTATLTLPKVIGSEERRTRIEEVLKIMGLWRSRDTQVGGALPGGILVRGLSGGEKRRLNIACALISAPSILFLDEPTTGLDSFAALNVMEHMSNLADLGHTIIASIHQPRSAIWDMFDKCVVLSEGHNLYFGSPKRALDWFSDALGYSYSYQRDGAVSDWLMDLVSVGFQKPASYHSRSMCSVQDVKRAAVAFAKESAEDIEKGVSGRSSPTKPSTPRAGGVGRQGSAKVSAGGPVRTRSSMAKAGSIASLEELEVVGKANAKKQMEWASGRYAASWWTQFRVLLKRAMLGQLRNPTDTTSRLFLSTWVGCLAGLAFYDLSSGPDSVTRRLALLFFILLLFELLPFCYMSFYVADRRFFAADISNDLYHPSAYYISSVIASMPFVVINSLCGCLCAYGLAGLRFQMRAVLLNLCITALQSMISIQLQVFCVWLTPNQDLAYVLATGYVAASILLSGFYLRIDDMKLAVMRGLSYLSYTKYAMEAVSKLELSGILYPPCPTGFNGAMPQGALAPGQALPAGTDPAQLAAMQNGGAMGSGQAPAAAAAAAWSPPVGGQSWQQSPSWQSPSPASWWQSPPPNGRAWSPASFGRHLLQSGADSEVVQIASGGLTPHCNTTGDDLLDFWGYKLSIGTCVGILCAFYVVFHIGSYLALSKLYKQKR